MLFTQATADDEAEIRRMLRENPMLGRIPVSFEREPDGLGGPHLTGERRCIILARDHADGPAVGLCERIVRPGFIDGEKRMLPYLGALRISQSHRRRIAILRGGFAALRDVKRSDEWPVALTSIADDNAPARRLLTAGVAGLPTYRRVGGFVTLIVRPQRSARIRGIREIEPDGYSELAKFLDEQMRGRQFSTRWSVENLRSLEGATYLVTHDGTELIGCVSLWDQRPFRQTVVHGYPGLLSAVRPAINFVGAAFGSPRLPRPGTAVRQAFLSHLAAKDDDPEIALNLVMAALDLAARRGLDAAVIGVPADHAWRKVIERQFRNMQYATTLYGVSWPDTAQSALSRDAHVFPEVGLL